MGLIDILPLAVLGAIIAALILLAAFLILIALRRK